MFGHPQTYGEATHAPENLKSDIIVFCTAVSKSFLDLTLSASSKATDRTCGRGFPGLDSLDHSNFMWQVLALNGRSSRKQAESSACVYILTEKETGHVQEKHGSYLSVCAQRSGEWWFTVM